MINGSYSIATTGSTAFYDHPLTDFAPKHIVSYSLDTSCRQKDKYFNKEMLNRINKAMKSIDDGKGIKITLEELRARANNAD